MGRKSKPQKNDAAAAPGGMAKQADSEVWTALKHEDEEELLELLFDELDDAESGETRRVQKPTARKAVNQANAKKVFPLSYAVAEGLDRSILELLLRAGATVNKKDESAEQSTALHGACWNEDGEAVELLLRAGADPRVADADGRTPLHVLATSNAANLMLRILDSISNNLSQKADGEEEGAHEGVAAAHTAALRLDPIAVLAIADKAQGSTVLHLALSESTYNFGVAQALCEYLERTQASGNKDGDAKSSVARLVSATAAGSGEAPLHALVSAANAEDAVVEALVRRLLALGADPLACNADGQSVMDVAVSSRPGCSSKAAERLYTTLLTAILEKDAAGATLAAKNRAGRALIHVAITSANTAAVKALCAAVPAELVPTVLGASMADSDVSVAELLATSSGSAEMAHALISVKAVARDVYEPLRKTHEALQAAHEAARQKAAEEEEEAARDGDDADGSGDGDGEDAEADNATMAAQLRKRQGTSGGAVAAPSGISRVQQARRARAATAAHRKQQGGGGHRGGHDGTTAGGGGLFGGGELSTPVKVVGVLLLLSVFISAYTMLFGLDGGSVEGA